MAFQKTFTGRAPIFLRLVAAVISGLLLSTCFPPLEFSWLIWFAIIPLLLCPFPKSWHGRLLIGYLFGYCHYATCLFWLNQVGFGAGFLLSLCCAPYLALWYAVTGAFAWQWRPNDTRSHTVSAVQGNIKQSLFILSSSSLWITLEWLRSWMFTGFPWNQLGISQFLNVPLLSTARYTGVYGLSFVIILTNITLAVYLTSILAKKKLHWGPLVLPVIACILLLTCVYSAPHFSHSETDKKLTVIGIQGNIPQCRFWTEEEFKFALDTYTGLTRQALQEYSKPDMVIWPESAVPADFGYPDFLTVRRKLLREIQVPLLLGAITYRMPNPPTEEPNMYNSALLLDSSDTVLACYDKLHRVPFGEYVPFSQYFPWLVEMIGMGRDLSPGRGFNMIPVPGRNINIGVNICFDDVFQEISAGFSKRGADMLMTLTNDAWYNESSGSRQHLSHSVFRAVENGKPFFRSGNNSDTCLIAPNGKILQTLQAPDGNPFHRGYALFQIDIPESCSQQTFYVRHGNIFAWLNVFVSIIGLFLYIGYRGKRKIIFLDAYSKATAKEK